MLRITLTVTLAIALVAGGYVATASANQDRASMKVAQEVKLYIHKEHKKRRSDPREDFEKLHKICGKSRTWTKGCKFWKPKSGKDKFMFQKRDGGKIYGIPSLLLK